MKDEIILYRPNELAEHIEVRIDEENETVWLNQYQLAELFQTDRTTILKHIQNIYSTGELDEKATCAKIAQVQKEGNRMVKREILNYNLDAILSVGYRVNSKQGTQFRIWANRILKDYLLKGYTINNRMNRIEDNAQAISEKVNREVYHLGASLKDLGKKWFAFSKLEAKSVEGILNSILELI
jgi:hypothetical protein